MCIVVLLPFTLQPLIPPMLPRRSIRRVGSAGPRGIPEAVTGRSCSTGTSSAIRMRIAVWILPSYVLGRMLIGVALGNSGMLTHPKAHRSRWSLLWWKPARLGGADHGDRGEPMDLVDRSSLPDPTCSACSGVPSTRRPPVPRAVLHERLRQLHAVDRFRPVLESLMPPAMALATTSAIRWSVSRCSTASASTARNRSHRRAAHRHRHPRGPAPLLPLVARATLRPAGGIWRSLTYLRLQPLR